MNDIDIDYVFKNKPEEYIRGIDPIGQTIQQSTNYLHLMTGDSLEECNTFIKNILKNKTNGIIDPKITFLERDQTTLDRSKQETNLSRYIYSSIKDRDIISPSLTTYIHPDIKPSLMVKYVEDLKVLRYKAKKAQFEYEQKHDEVNALRSFTEQVYRKQILNGGSGAMCSPSNILYNKTGHSTLTSNCRLAASITNANTERLLSGNRHYWSLAVVLNNIVSTISNINEDLINSVMIKYKLKYPSVQDVVDCLKRSSDLYQKNTKYYQDNIIPLLNKLNPTQLAAIIYTGDLYHIRVHNEKFIREFVTDMSLKIIPTLAQIEIESNTNMKSLNEDCLMTSHHLCMEEMRGKGTNYKEMDTEALATLVSTCKHLQQVIINKADFIRAFFVTTNIPSSVAKLPQMMRRCVVTSDTDSTIFTVGEWVNWFFGRDDLSSAGKSIAGAMIYFSTQTIVHILAITSSNMGVAIKNLHDMAMKNEYYWPIFANVDAAKHYYALCEIKEGNVYEKLKWEVKGSNLKPSTAPKRIQDDAKKMMDSILSTLLKGENVQLLPLLKKVGDIERKIINTIQNNETTFFRAGKIKEAEGYKKDETESPYKYYLFWQDIFKDSYGDIDEPPYNTFALNLTIKNRTAIKKWLEAIDDLGLRGRLAKWFIDNEATSLNTVYLPIEYLRLKGIPKELLMVIDSRKIAHNLCNVFYMILGSLNFHLKKERLVSDFY